MWVKNAETRFQRFRNPYESRAQSGLEFLKKFKKGVKMVLLG
jgi:hypothetical protein